MTCILTVQGGCVSDWLGNLGSRWHKAVRDVKEQLQGPGPDMTLAREPLLIRCDRSRPAADVILAPDAQQRLTPTKNPASPPDFSEIFVLLAEAEGNDGQHIEVYIGEHRLGTLTSTDSADFRAVLAAAKSQDKQVAGQAIRDRDAHGAWALHVYRPELT
jgi:hypothetical protein